uniref:Tissue factor pathway inhibitor n=1 Tax=Coturnix japonica TaxID=93934 RepID=A0A8C2YCN1_COTJA
STAYPIFYIWCMLLFFLPSPCCHLPLFAEKPNLCYHDKDPGICRGFFSRYFYNKETKKCELFMYGGCLGNRNNFRSLEECQATCQGNRMGTDIVLPYAPNDHLGKLFCGCWNIKRLLSYGISRLISCANQETITKIFIF